MKIELAMSRRQAEKSVYSKSSVVACLRYMAKQHGKRRVVADGLLRDVERCLEHLTELRMVVGEPKDGAR